MFLVTDNCKLLFSAPSAYSARDIFLNKKCTSAEFTFIEVSREIFLLTDIFSAPFNAFRIFLINKKAHRADVLTLSFR